MLDPTLDREKRACLGLFKNTPPEMQKKQPYDFCFWPKQAVLSFVSGQKHL